MRWDGSVLAPAYPDIEGDLSALLARQANVFVGGDEVAVLPREDDGEWVLIVASASSTDLVGNDVWLIGQRYDGFGPLRQQGYPAE